MATTTRPSPEGKPSPEGARLPFTVAFYDPATHAPDAEGRNLPTILAYSDRDLEYHHDFIQYLFPLPEASPFNPRAPTLDAATRAAFLARPELRAALTRATLRMCAFYGFDITTAEAEGDNRVAVVARRGSHWDRNSRLWRTRFGHNHLRISRMIRCLRVLGLERLARGFHATLLAHDEGGATGARTRMFWERAAERGLWLAPEEEDEEASGVKWLRGEGHAEGESGFDAQMGRMAVLAREEVPDI